VETKSAATVVELTDWRRRVAELYATVRATDDPAAGHEVWRTGRDALLRDHPQSPVKPDDPLRATGVPVWPYDPALRWELAIGPADDLVRDMDSANDGQIRMRRIGQVELPAPIGATLDVWWFEQYGGGLFLPLRDGTAGTTTYGAGRYLLDTAKGADLGGTLDGSIVVDLNFAYHPSCRYDDRWQCPLAPAGNMTSTKIEAGERL
jgi:uncharacterized protein (DUF1684 family)